MERTRLGKTRQDTTRQNWTGLGRTRQGKTRQDITLDQTCQDRPGRTRHNNNAQKSITTNTTKRQDVTERGRLGEEQGRLRERRTGSGTPGADPVSPGTGSRITGAGCCNRETDAGSPGTGCGTAFGSPGTGSGGLRKMQTPLPVPDAAMATNTTFFDKFTPSF